MKPYQITIVGCGPGALDHLTPAARTAIEQAQVLVGADRLLAAFPESKAERIVVRADIKAVLRQIASRVSRKRVVVLVSGDPGLCSLAKPVIKQFGLKSCRIIPGISSIQVAFARVGLDWPDARILSAHDRLPDVDAARLGESKKIAILAGNKQTLSWIYSTAKALAKSHRVFVCENLTLTDESVRCVTAARLPSLALASRTIILLIQKELIA